MVSSTKESVRSFDKRLSCRDRLFKLLQQLRSACRAPERFSLTLEVFGDALMKLEEYCEEYFRREEQSADLPTFEPLNEWEMAERHADHRELLKKLHEITLRAIEIRFWGDVDVVLPSIAARFLDFHDRFLEHEARDEELIFDSYLQDLGGGD